MKTQTCVILVNPSESRPTMPSTELHPLVSGSPTSIPLALLLMYSSSFQNESICSSSMRTPTCHFPPISLCWAWKQLKQAKREAAQLCKKHLEALLNQAIAANQQKKTKALAYLIWAEKNQLCYAWFHNHTKPKLPGALAFVNAPTKNGETQTLLDCNELKTMLLKFSRTHFAKVEGSLFTQEPLNYFYNTTDWLPLATLFLKAKTYSTCTTVMNRLRLS